MRELYCRAVYEGSSEDFAFSSTGALRKVGYVDGSNNWVSRVSCGKKISKNIVFYNLTSRKIPICCHALSGASTEKHQRHKPYLVAASSSAQTTQASPTQHHRPAAPTLSPRKMTSLFDLNQPVVADLGSGLTKAGFAGSAEPTALIGTLVGRPKHPQVMPLSAPVNPPSSTVAAVTANTALSNSPNSSRSKYLSEGVSDASRRSVVVGDALRSLSGVIRLSNPMERASVVNWPDAEELWRHVLYDLLKVGHGEHPMLVTENAWNARKNRERLAEFFFETVQTPCLYVAVPAILALYATGRTTGMVVDVGDTVASMVPVVEGHCDVHAIRRLEIGGRDVTERLTMLMRKEGHGLFGSSSEKQVVRRVKERLGYVALNPREEEHRYVADDSCGETFELPDGEVVNVGAERFRAPEILFRPELVAREFGGVQWGVKEAIEAGDLELRKRLYGSILLAVSFCMCMPRAQKYYSPRAEKLTFSTVGKNTMRFYCDLHLVLTFLAVCSNRTLVNEGWDDQVPRLRAAFAGGAPGDSSAGLEGADSCSPGSVDQRVYGGIDSSVVVHHVSINGSYK